MLFLWVALGTIAGDRRWAACTRSPSLSAGGEAVALMLGGRAVNPQTTDLAERRLLNVVEEMALASGIPVPPVYVLDHEPGINAFAAGHQPGDAVVAVSAGCLQYLTREELQGVMGHEFSHILNGDMRLNLRLIGIVYGILVLAIIGYYVMRSSPACLRRATRKRAGAAAAIFVLGLALLILGYLGVFFGKLIKSAISRQREFLADASSVQFTRNPGGIAGALKKIGGLAEGSRIRDGHAEEISHMFFGDAFAGSFFNLFATHPPLDERIRALEPEFRRPFPRGPAAGGRGRSRRGSAGRAGRRRCRLPAIRTGVAAAAAGHGVGCRATWSQQIGRPQTEHLSHAGQMVGGMPQPLLDAAREPFAAQAVIYALLLSRDDEATRSRQLQLLQGQIEPPLYQETQQLAAAGPVAACRGPAAAGRSGRARAQEVLAAAVCAVSPGRRGPGGGRRQGRPVRILSPHGAVQLPGRPLRAEEAAGGPLSDRSAAVAQPAAVVLSTLAYVGQKQPEDVQRAFQAGAAEPARASRARCPSEQCTLQAFDAALAELAQASPNVKRRMHRRRDGLHRRRRPGDPGRERAAAGHRRRAGVPRAADDCRCRRHLNQPRR